VAEGTYATWVFEPESNAGRRWAVMRRLAAVLLGVLLLAGCWDYQGLGEQTVVAGIAVDLLEEGEGFQLTFEIVDLMGGEGGQFGSILLTTSGETLAEAVHDAHARLRSPIYLGVADVVIVGRLVAEQIGVETIVDYLIRDRHARNSLRIVVSSTDTAAELFDPAASGGDGGEEQGATEQQRVLLSQALSESLSPERRGVSSATDARMAYEIYHILGRGTSALTLPIVSPSETVDVPFELDGLAIFEGDRMVASLPEEDMSLYLLLTSNLQDRVFPVEIEGGQRAVIAVRRSRARVDFALESGAARFFFDIHVTADVVQLPDRFGPADRQMLAQLEADAARALGEEIIELAGRLGDEGHDILGLAEVIRTRDPRLWAHIEGDWEVWLGGSEIVPLVEVRVENTGMKR